MKKNIVLACAAMVFCIMAAHAVPAKPGVKRIIRQADGTTIELTLKGDEHYSFYADDAGNCYQLNGTTLTKLSSQQVTESWSALRKLHRNFMTESKVSRRAGTPSNTTTGKQHGLVLLLQYPDQPFVTENPRQTFDDFFNSPGYNGYGNSGSVRDYFLEQSYGKLDITFDVVGPFTTKEKMSYYGKPYTDSSGNKHHDSHTALMVAEAVDAAAASVDFSKYDWDKDGLVDQIFVVFAGYNEAQGADENTIWPHEWRLEGEGVARNYNGVGINVYGCASECKGDGKTVLGMLDGIGTACHEFSHCLGLPDMYDTSASGNNFGMYVWDVMDYGSYNDDSRTPAGYTSYERWFARWLEPKEINTMTRIEDMKPINTAPECYILYNDANKNEYYLLENRQQVGFDKGLDGHGLLILHVDYNEGSWTTNSINNSAEHQRMTIIPADGTAVRGSATTIAGDPWPGIKGNTSLTNYTTPAATLYNNNKDGRKFMSKAIDNIREDVQNHTVSFVVCRPELGIPQLNAAPIENNDGTFSISWSSVENALGYEIELTTLNKAASTPEEAFLWSTDLNSFYSKTTGTKDLASSLSGTDLNGWSGEKIYASPKKLRLGTSKDNGLLRSPAYQSPEASSLTMVVGMEQYAEGTTVDGKVSVQTGDTNYEIATSTPDEKSFTVGANAKHVFQFDNLRKRAIQISIQPKGRLYINYIAFYDGLWTASQLGIESSSRALRAAASSSAQYITSETNSYTFKGLDVFKRYVYRVRALGEENTFSQWSEEQAFEFSSTAVENIKMENTNSVDSRIYDLSGREVKTPAKGIYVRNGRKVVVK